MKVYTIPGDPTPLMRHRHTKDGRTYDPQKHIKFAHGCMIKQQHGSLPYYEGPLRIQGICYMRIPKRPKPHQKPGYWHIERPDTSNMQKHIEDVCTEILYKDDCLLASVVFEKIYDLNPRLEFSILELTNPRRNDDHIYFAW